MASAGSVLGGGTVGLGRVPMGAEGHAPAVTALPATHTTSAGAHGDTHSRYLNLGVWLRELAAAPADGLFSRRLVGGVSLLRASACGRTEWSQRGPAPHHATVILAAAVAKPLHRWFGTRRAAQLSTGCPRGDGCWLCRDCPSPGVVCMPTALSLHRRGRAAGYPLLLAGHEGLEAGRHAEAQLVNEGGLLLAVDLHLHPRLVGGLVCKAGRASGVRGSSRAMGRAAGGLSPVSPQTGRYSSCWTLSISSRPFPAPPCSVVSTSRPGPPELKV